MSRDRVTVDLRGLGTAIRKRCDKQGIDISEFVVRALANAMEKAPPEWRTGRARCTGRRIKLSTTVAADVHDKIMQAVRVSGARNLSRYIEALVEQGVTPKVIQRGVPPEELAAQVRSNYELHAIGRNLNQIAKSLNMAPGKMTSADRDLLATLPEHIKHHVELVSKTLLALNPPRRTRGK
jgi:hypothetical protein